MAGVANPSVQLHREHPRPLQLALASSKRAIPRYTFVPPQPNNPAASLAHFASAVLNRSRAGRTDAFGHKTITAEHNADVTAALNVIPNADLSWDEWNRIGMATWAATEGCQEGFEAFAAWSQKSAKYDPDVTRARWDHFPSSPPNSIGAGTLFYLAAEAVPGWRKPSDEKRPVIRIVAGELPRMVDEGEAALIAAGTPIFVRAGALVRPVPGEAPAAHGRSTVVAKLRSYCRDSLTDALSRVAEFQRFKCTGEGRPAASSRQHPSRAGRLLESPPRGRGDHHANAACGRVGALHAGV
jgi:hypothetical protein